jgi:hypothetical protein
VFGSLIQDRSAELCASPDKISQLNSLPDKIVQLSSLQDKTSQEITSQVRFSIFVFQVQNKF